MKKNIKKTEKEWKEQTEYEVVSLSLFNFHCIAMFRKLNPPNELVLWAEAVKWNFGDWYYQKKKKQKKMVSTKQNRELLICLNIPRPLLVSQSISSVTFVIFNRVLPVDTEKQKECREEEEKGKKQWWTQKERDYHLVDRLWKKGRIKQKENSFFFHGPLH